MTTAYLNRIATAVPPHDVHEAFVGFARTILRDNRRRMAFDRMAERAQIDHRWSSLDPDTELGYGDPAESRFYTLGAFPGTAARMQKYETAAPQLAGQAVEGLALGCGMRNVTHLITVTCTGFVAPGIDRALIHRFGLSESVERVTVGFMGCQAGINALRLARHIIRSEPKAWVLVVGVELCTLHLQETGSLDRLLSFLLFGDGCAAALVTAAPEGLALDRFQSALARDTEELITWRIGDGGFDMFLSGQVPGAIRTSLRSCPTSVTAGALPDDMLHWAVHPGGRTILDAVQAGLGLMPSALDVSREVLRRFGNMSSVTILFVLQAIMQAAAPRERGCAAAFGPGLSVESFSFHVAG